MRSALIICLLFSGSAALAEIRGPARVVDGDTLRIADVDIRVHGIDAPEAAQDCLTPRGRAFACGDAATQALRAMTEGHEVSCRALELDRYGRTVARCSTRDGDLGQRMVARGYATAYRRYSTDYVAEEDRARAGGIGLWGAQMQDPADFRAQVQAAAPADAPPGDCAIKGNVSGNGRIYHRPGQAFYDDTQISASRGERWFCTAAEAEAAGWRPARR